MHRTNQLITKLVVFTLLSALMVTVPFKPKAAGAEGFGPVLRWHDFFCLGDEVPLVGKFNDDARDDVACLLRDSHSDDRAGDVYVALSTGSGFAPHTVWNQNLTRGGELPLVGDANGDGRDDIITFVRSSWGEGETMGDVLVALSNGTAFLPPVKWHDDFCRGQETPLVGDFDADRRDDIACLIRDSHGTTSPLRGDVYISMSDGLSFTPHTRWHDGFTLGNETPTIGDVNGDRRDDIVTFVLGAWGDDRTQGHVYAGLSDGSKLNVHRWHRDFGRRGQLPAVGDVTGDRYADAVTFLRDSAGEPNAGDAYQATSNGLIFAGVKRWHENFGRGAQQVMLGDFNGDGMDDAIAFVRDDKPEPYRGDVYVSITGDPARPYPTTAQAFGYGSLRAVGDRPLLVIMLEYSDFRFNAASRRTETQQERFFGSGYSLTRHFREMSNSRFAWVSAGIHGPFIYPDDAATRVDESRLACAHGNADLDRDGRGECPPVDGSGTSSDPFKLRAKAIEMAIANGFDLAPHDRNGDNVVAASELQVVIVEGRTGAASARHVDCILPGTIAVCPGAVANIDQENDFQSSVHEMAHMLGAHDVYGPVNTGFAQNSGVTLMGPTGGNDALELDAWHKIQLGWVRPRIYSMQESGSCAVLRAPNGGVPADNDRRPVILFDPRLVPAGASPSEYFVLEYRTPKGIIPSDAALADPSGGIAVWQVKTVAAGELAKVDAPVITAGANKTLESTPQGDDVRVPNSDNGGYVYPGPDRVLQTPVQGDDGRGLEHALLNVSAPTSGVTKGAPGGSGLWQGPDGVIAPRYHGGGLNPLRIKAGTPSSDGATIAVKWTMHSFAGALASSYIRNAAARACYSRVP